MNTCFSNLGNHLVGAKICKHLYNLPDKRTHIYFRKKTRDLYVVFKGTSTFEDWKKNVAILPTQEGVHRGFKEHAQICKEELIKSIQDNDKLKTINLNEINKVYCIAHSLGASALLILMYELLLSKEISNIITHIDIDIVMFGSPKSGNTTFLDRFRNMLHHYDNIQLYRYTLKDDYVKHFPPGLTYDHICEDIVLNPELSKYLSFQHSIHSYINQMENYNLDLYK